MVQRFLLSGRTGFYVAVLREGEVGAGDEVSLVSPEPSAIPVSEMVRLYIAKEYDSEDARLARRAINVAALTDSWKEIFRG